MACRRLSIALVAPGRYHAPMSLQHLLIMRHAKSSWSEGRLSDHERPLNERGVRAAHDVGGVLRAKQILPKTIWSSDSARTRETVAKLGLDMDDVQIDYLADFYHAPANKVLYVCEGRGAPGAGPLMLVGHNPGWEDLFYHFAGMSRRMPTGACAIFARTKSKTDWLAPESWRLLDYILPRDLEE